MLEELFSFPENEQIQPNDSRYKIIDKNMTILASFTNKNLTMTGDVNIHVVTLFILKVRNSFENTLKINIDEILEYKYMRLSEIKNLLNSDEACSGFKIIWNCIINNHLY